MDLLRAQVFIGLLLDTLPLIPPPAGGPPDSDPPGDDGPPPDDPPDGDGLPGDNGSPDTPRRRGSADPGVRPPGRRHPLTGRIGPGSAPSGSAHSDTVSADGSPGRARPGGTARGSPGGDRGRRCGSTTAPHPGNTGPPGTGSTGETGPPGDRSPGRPPAPGATGVHPADDTEPPDPAAADPWPDAPPLTDADAPADDGFSDPPLPDPSGYEDLTDGSDPLDDHFASRDPVPAWPVTPAAVPAPPASAADSTGRPPTGLLDLAVPWSTLTCESAAPGQVGRIGPVTAAQARHLARIAATDHATNWRIILTDGDSHAIAVGRVPPGHLPPDLQQPGTAGLVGRVTVTMPAAALSQAPVAGTAAGSGILTEIHRAAARAWDRAAQLAEMDLATAGGCAHALASAAYRPPPRIREYVAART
jgi:hypothetical protein